MHIDWTALGKTALLSAIIGIAVVCAFTVGVLGLARVDTATEQHTERGKMTGYALSGVAFAFCVGSVLYGLYLIIPQFHHHH
jgi:hypothetical protein